MFKEFGQGVGFLSFHKYEAWGTWLTDQEGYYSNEELLKKAGGEDTDPQVYTPQEMQQIWYRARGQLLPIICSETNLNSAYKNGTDPRIQQIIGAVWYAEELRTFVQKGLTYSIYYHFASDDSPEWNSTKLTQGWGFGMVKETSPFTEWYSYLVNYLVGNYLEAGDEFYEASSDKPDFVSVMAWRAKNNYLRVILLCKNPNATAVNIKVMPQDFVTYKIDKTNNNIVISNNRNQSFWMDIP